MGTSSTGSPPLGAPEGPKAPGLVGGIVAHNDESTIGRSLHSLLSQELPEGTRWDAIWVVCSGCSDRTVEIVEAIAARDPIVEVVVEAERRGKAVALNRILREARGRTMILLNGDAVASPRAVASLITEGQGAEPPFAVMGHPTVHGSLRTPMHRMLALQWRLHHELHREALRSGTGNHLSDELLLVSAPEGLELPEGTINDGSYIGAWLAVHGGRRMYAPEAEVAIEVPGTLRDHLTQRRRIRVGHSEVARRVGVRPTTFPEFALRHPVRALRVVRRTLAGSPGAYRDFAFLLGAELTSGLLAFWDLIPPKRDHHRWERISRPVPSPGPLAP